MTLHSPIAQCEYETRVERRGDSVVLISCPITSDPTIPHVELSFTPDEAETVGADLIEAARRGMRARA